MTLYIHLAQLRWISLARLERLRVGAFELVPFTSWSLVLLVIFVTWYHLIPTRDYLELGYPLELKESSSEELISKFSSCGCQFIYELVVDELVISKLDIDDLSIWLMQTQFDAIRLSRANESKNQKYSSKTKLIAIN